jgi:hypothetical protein
VRRAPWVLALSLLAAGPLAAQIGRENFVQPDTAYDAVHAPQRDAFITLRDSTSSISAAGARLMSDLTPASSLAWMQARARAVVKACARSSAPLAAARAVVTGATWPAASQQKAQASLLKAMTTFDGQLTACTRRWTALAADTSQTSLRENAPYEMQVLEDQLGQFNRTAQTYLQYIQVVLHPPGSPKS